MGAFHFVKCGETGQLRYYTSKGAKIRKRVKTIAKRMQTEAKV